MEELTEKWNSHAEEKKSSDAIRRRAAFLCSIGYLTGKSDSTDKRRQLYKTIHGGEKSRNLLNQQFSSIFMLETLKAWPEGVEKLPFIPTEQELDTLINGCGPKTSAFLQLLKETGMRAGEAWNLKWTDVDFVNNTIGVTPEKGSSPRIFKVSSKLLCMLNSLPKKSQKISAGIR